jgi:hypothetical protein
MLLCFLKSWNLLEFRNREKIVLIQNRVEIKIRDNFFINQT